MGTIPVSVNGVGFIARLIIAVSHIIDFVHTGSQQINVNFEMVNILYNNQIVHL